MKKLPSQLPARRSFLRLALGTGAGAVIGGGLLAACGGGDPQPQVADGREQPLNTTSTCAPVTYPVVTQTGVTVGTMTVSNTTTDLVLDFAPGAGCSPMTQVFVWVGSDLALVPANLFGVNHFGFPIQVPVGAPDETARVTIPLNSIALPSDPCAQPLYILAKVFSNCDFAFAAGSGTYLNTTYVRYQLCGLDCTVLEGCETAFAKGGYVFASDGRANPEGLASLALARNRWGWAIRRLASDGYGTTTHDIYAGAGLNRIANATQVGTASIAWDGTTATVTYALASGVVMTEAHLYAGSTRPTTIAPGQYGNIADFVEPATSHTFTVPLSGGEAWFIVHAVVC